MAEVVDPVVEPTPPAEAETPPAPSAEPSSPPPASDGTPEAQGAAPATPPASGAADGVTWQDRTLAARDARIAELEAALVAKAEPAAPPAPVPGAKPLKREFTEEEVNARARLMAAQELRREAFDNACNEVAQAGLAVNKDFVEKINGFQKFGGVTPAFLEAAVESGSGHQVLYHLAGNLDEAARLNALPANKMVAEITKLAIKLGTAAAVSRAPPPVDPIQPSGGNGEGLSENLSTDEWMKRRNADVERKQKAAMMH